MSKQGITVTFCECAENHVGNQQLGTIAEQGFTYAELERHYLRLSGFGIKCELIDLGQWIPIYYGRQQAGVLIIRSALSFISDVNEAWNELCNLNYDKKALMYGEVKNKNARHNLCFADFDQEPDYENGMGTVISFNRLPELNKLRTFLPALLGPKASNLLAEANNYYDIDQCGIGYHGDKERRIVIGMRYGASFPLCFYWYQNHERVSKRFDIHLDHGDLYVMDEKACGSDSNKASIPTLRHAAGCAKYIK